MLKRAAKSLLYRAVKRYPKHANAAASFIHQKTGFTKKQNKRLLLAGGQDVMKPLRFDFSKLPSPVEHSHLLRSLHDAGLLTEQQIHVWLLGLFADRRFPEFESIIGSPVDGLEHLWLYHATRLEHYRGRPHTDDASVLSLAEAVEDKPHLSALAINLAVQQFCLSGNLGLLRIALGRDNERASRLSRVSVMGAVRLLQKHQRDHEAVALIRTYLAGASDDLKLYFIEPILALGGNVAEDLGMPGDWHSTLNLFKQTFASSDETVQNEFQHFLFEPLDKISETADYMDIRIDPAAKQRLQELFVSSLRQHKPLSLVRLGDGEAYALPSPDIASAPENAFDRDNEVRELHWWGSEPSDETRDRIKSAAFEAIAKADILGIPSVYRLIRDRGRSGSPLGIDRSKRGLATVLNGLRNHLPPTERILTEERCHQVLFDEDFLRVLIEQADHVVIVSCWTKEQLEAEMFEAAEFIQIPPHTKVRDGLDEQAPLYEVYEEIDDAIARSVRPGTLMLLGAGLIGKIFLQTAKEKGAVALDVGSVLDYLAGRKTRSVADMV